MQRIKGGIRRRLDALLRGRYAKVKPHNSRPQRERCAGAKRGSDATPDQLQDWRALTWDMDLMAVKRPQPRDGQEPDARRMADYLRYRALIDEADTHYDTLLVQQATQARSGRPKGAKDRQKRTIKNRLQPMRV
jgi:hypothetical protein